MSSEIKALHARLANARGKVLEIEGLIRRWEEAEAEAATTSSSERRAKASEQAHAMLGMRNSGTKWADIALAFNVTTTAARDIVRDYQNEQRRKAEYDTPWGRDERLLKAKYPKV